MLLRSILAVLWTAFIFYALLSPPSGVPKYWWLELSGMDKLIHAVLFGVEAFLVAWNLVGNKFQRPMLWSLLWCFLLGGGLELAQFYWATGRDGDFLDLLADMVGAVIAIVGFPQIRKKFTSIVE
ncbi:MAG: hypothetical protein GC178_17815 [Flavobacteriales bacterium]|nr:hypothetical protein [Flavobacteriales bacterium]